MKHFKFKKIRLEASSACQLRCPSCPTASKAIVPHVGSGFLQFSDFKKLVDENPQVKEIELSNYGEIFLNPQLLEIIKYAYERGIALTADNGVNLNDVKGEVLEGLIKYKFQSMTVSIDGTSQETYQCYRIRGDYDAVLENIKKINFFKEQYQSKYPILSWQFIVFGYNEHELLIGKKLAKELNLNFYPKLSWDSEFSPVQNKKMIRSALGAASRGEYKEKEGKDYMLQICHQLWEQPQINWDGKVLGCCRNFWGDFGGNAFSDGLLESLNNDKINYARKMLLGRQIMRPDIPCSSCEIYLTMKKEGVWLRRGITRWFIAACPAILKRLLRKIFAK